MNEHEKQMAKDEAYRGLEDERNDGENRLYNSATDMREFNYMRLHMKNINGRPDLPRDQMTAADYIRARKFDFDPMGRRIK